MSFKPFFSRFLQSRPGRLHFAAHSHHAWPDVSFEAHKQAWLDAAELMDGKWEHIFGEVIPTAQAHFARLLNLSDPASLCFAPNTHELLLRLISSIETRPFNVLTTDSEFHSFSRQIRRMEEAGACRVTRVAVQPFASFCKRFADAASEGGHHLVFLSQVFFNTGFVAGDLAGIVDAVPSRRALIAIDGYHAFMAMPVDLSRIADRVFYLGGGYKYAMSGEGLGYMHCPPSYAPRPVDTGWFAGFGALSAPQDGSVAYAPDGARFMGATFDATGLYRFNAVMDWMRTQQLTPTQIHSHVRALQDQFLTALDASGAGALAGAQLIPPRGVARGNFLCFRTPAAGELYAKLLRKNVITDYRNDRLRIGFGIYHDEADVVDLVGRVRALAQS